MVVKLNLANAFDRVKHSFLLKVLQKIGFGEKFINWIRACISEPWIAPLVNGKAANFFKATRGLKQGCPLSPLLFVLQASVLSFYLDKKRADQDIAWLYIARGVKDINHAQFVDDTLLLGGANINSARTFKKELDIYREVLGSKINYLKSMIYGWNCSVKDLTDITRLLEMEKNPDLGVI